MRSHITLPGLRHPFSSAIVRSANPGLFKKYVEGQVFRLPCSRSKTLYILLSGFAKTSTASYSGMEDILGFAMPGDVLDLGHLAPSRILSDTIFLSDALVAEFSLAEATLLEISLGGLGAGVADLISRELLRIRWRNRFVRHASAITRVAQFLIEMGRRFSEIQFSPVQFRLFMPREDIAIFLGMTKCTLSRAIHALQNEGLIAIDGRWILIRGPVELSRR